MKIIFTILFLVCIQFIKGQSPIGSAGSGCALFFDGTSTYVEVPSSPSLNVSNQITIEAWIYWMGHHPSQSCDNQIILNRERECGCCQYEIAISNTCTGTSPGRFMWYLSNVTGGTNLCAGWKDGGFFVPQNQWIHVAVAYNGSRVRVYFNGNVAIDVPASGTILSSTVPLRIGCRGHVGSCSTSPHCFHHGYIDEVRIWNRGLTGAEIRQNMCRRLTGHEPGLVGYWRFDECSGNMALDSSPNGNHGTLY